MATVKFSKFAGILSSALSQQHLLQVKVNMLVTQLCLILCDPLDYNPPSSSVHGILQTRILEWVAIPFSKRSYQHRDKTWSPALQADSLLVEDSEPPGKQYLLGFKIAQLEYHHLHLLCSSRWFAALSVRQNHHEDFYKP